MITSGWARQRATVGTPGITMITESGHDPATCWWCINAGVVASGAATPMSSRVDELSALDQRVFVSEKNGISIRKMDASDVAALNDALNPFAGKP